MSIAQGSEQSGTVRVNDLSGAVDINTDSGFFEKESLDHSAGESLPAGGVEHKVEGVHHFGDLFGRDQASQGHAVAQSKAFEPLFIPGAVWTAADPDKADVGRGGDHGGHGRDGFFVSLVAKKPGDGPDGHVLVLDAPCAAPALPCLRIRGELPRVHAGGDGHEAVAGCESGGDGLLDHGVGDGNELRGVARGTAFEKAVNKSDRGGLGAVEAHAVDGMDDDGDAGTAGSAASKDSGLAAVGVNDIGGAFAEHPSEFGKGEGVMREIDGAAEVAGGEDFRAGVMGLGPERAFGTGFGSGDEGDAVAAVHKSAAGEDGVLLRTADDEAGDDVDDVHVLAPQNRLKISEVVLTVVGREDKCGGGR